MVTYLEEKENFHRNVQKIICTEYEEYLEFVLETMQCLYYGYKGEN